jgi:hypothetical protein
MWLSANLRRNLMPVLWVAVGATCWGHPNPSRCDRMQAGMTKLMSTLYPTTGKRQNQEGSSPQPPLRLSPKNFISTLKYHYQTLGVLRLERRGDLCAS